MRSVDRRVDHARGSPGDVAGCQALHGSSDDVLRGVDEGVHVGQLAHRVERQAERRVHLGRAEHVGERLVHPVASGVLLQVHRAFDEAVHPVVVQRDIGQTRVRIAAARLLQAQRSGRSAEFEPELLVGSGEIGDFRILERVAEHLVVLRNVAVEIREAERVVLSCLGRCRVGVHPVAPAVGLLDDIRNRRSRNHVDLAHRVLLAVVGQRFHESLEVVHRQKHRQARAAGNAHVLVPAVVDVRSVLQRLHGARHDHVAIHVLVVDHRVRAFKLARVDPLVLDVSAYRVVVHMLALHEARFDIVVEHVGLHVIEFQVQARRVGRLVLCAGDERVEPLSPEVLVLEHHVVVIVVLLGVAVHVDGRFQALVRVG